MTHCSEETLILHGIGEAESGDEIEQHLDACPACAAAYRSITDILQLVSAPPDVPSRDESYGIDVWQRVQALLPLDGTRWWTMWLTPKPLMLAAAMAVAILVAAFAVGHVRRAPPPAAVASREPAAMPDTDGIRLAATGAHLEQSERLLLDLVNADGGSVDLSDQQRSAADLIDANRLYRDAATHAGDQLMATVLDDLERSLLDIVHGPSTMTPAQRDDIRAREDTTSLLFKVRVLADELQERAIAPLPLRNTI